MKGGKNFFIYKIPVLGYDKGYHSRAAPGCGLFVKRTREYALLYKMPRRLPGFRRQMPQLQKQQAPPLGGGGHGAPAPGGPVHRRPAGTALRPRGRGLPDGALQRRVGLLPVRQRRAAHRQAGAGALVRLRQGQRALLPGAPPGGGGARRRGPGGGRGDL